MRSSRKSKHKRSTNVWVYIVILIVLLSFVIFFFYKMQSNQSNTDQDGVTSTGTTPNIEEEENYSLYLKRYFMPNGTTAYFKGTGNEFASYKETTTWLGENHVQTVINNGGATVEKIYRITMNEVQLVLQQELPEEPMSTYTEQELNALETTDIILLAPFEEGKKMGNRKITNMNTEIDTEYGHFKDVITVEEVFENGKNIFFYAPDYGLVRTEFYMDNELVVSSELASIGKPYWE